MTTMTKTRGTPFKEQNRASRDGTDIAVAEAVDQGAIVSGSNNGKTLEIPPLPPQLDPKEWLRIQCCIQVWASVASGESSTITEACELTGWGVSFYYKYRNSPLVRDWMLEQLGDTWNSLADQIRVGMPQVIRNMHRIAIDKDPLTRNGTASVAAAKFLSSQLKDIDGRLAESRQQEGGDGLREESRALAAQRAVWELEKEQHYKLTRVTETVEVTPLANAPARDEPGSTIDHE